MNLADLNKIALAMVAPGKGILAADESSGTIKKRFDAIKVESTEQSRRDYREMLFRSSEAMRQYISGVILYDETIWQDAADGMPLVRLIEQSGAIPGIKVDEGTQALPGCPGELVTSGLDKLAERLKKYYERGARFAKWRAVIDIGEGTGGLHLPSMTAIHVNAHALARYAALCQAAQIVPIVEPEVLMDGGHDIDRCYDVTQRVLNKTFQELRVQRVALEGMILKPNMVISYSISQFFAHTIRLSKVIKLAASFHPAHSLPICRPPSGGRCGAPGCEGLRLRWRRQGGSRRRGMSRSRRALIPSALARARADRRRGRYVRARTG